MFNSKMYCYLHFDSVDFLSYTCRQTHSQNGAWENDESRNRGSNRVTEKTTLVVARLQSVTRNIYALMSERSSMVDNQSNIYFVPCSRSNYSVLQFTSTAYTHKFASHLIVGNHLKFLSIFMVDAIVLGPCCTECLCNWHNIYWLTAIAQYSAN
jgi:hypothetical protein